MTPAGADTSNPRQEALTQIDVAEDVCEEGDVTLPLTVIECRYLLEAAVWGLIYVGDALVGVQAELLNLQK